MHEEVIGCVMDSSRQQDTSSVERLEVGKPVVDNGSRNTAAESLRMQRLHKIVPGTSILPYPGSPIKVRHNIASMFSVRSLWATDEERKTALHRRRRKLQKTYHINVLNSQYTYYGAGLLSNHDLFPEHQDRIKEKYGLKPKQS
uniref:Uncharacterized protein n=1 Tax=Onchocerca volvulus TaxID=6282 RepID=A0A8R1XQ66_ONCVO